MTLLGLEEGPLVGVALDAIVSAIERGDLAPDDRLGAIQLARDAVECAGS